MASIKGPGQAQEHDGSNLRIAIVHARWNTELISALVSGTLKALRASGVRDENIVVQDVPGSYELPLAVQRVYSCSKYQAANAPIQATSAVTDLLSSVSLTDLTKTEPTQSSTTAEPTTTTTSSAALAVPLITPFDAIIAIGVLIKGETMHFEYIADAVSHGLMKLQLDTEIPVIFGLLTVLTEEQGKARAGLLEGTHCHGEDWGKAAVELGVKRQAWAVGKFL